MSNGASFGLTGDQYFLDYPIGYLTETHVDYIRVWKPGSNTAIKSVSSVALTKLFSNGKVLKFNISDLDNDFTNSAVYDLYGKCINENLITNGENTITFKNKLNAGVYIFKLQEKLQNKTIKFVVAN